MCREKLELTAGFAADGATCARLRRERPSIRASEKRFMSHLPFGGPRGMRTALQRPALTGRGTTRSCVLPLSIPPVRDGFSRVCDEMETQWVGPAFPACRASAYHPGFLPVPSQ